MGRPALAGLRSLVAIAAASGGAMAVVTFACIPDLPLKSTASDGSVTDDGPDDDAEASGDGGPGPGFCGDGIIQLDREQCDPGEASTPLQCKSCKVICNGVVWSRNNHCYVDLPDGAVTDNTVAAGRCGLPSHLVTFASEQEIEAVIDPLEAGPYWVGFASRQVPNQYLSLSTGPEPGWTQNCAGCYVHTSDPTVIPGSPLANCVQGYPQLDASWTTTSCLNNPTPLDVICEREPLGHLWTPCAAGYCFDLPFTFGYKHYVYVATQATADAAAAQCAQLGGLVVVLQSRDEREQMWRELVSLPTEVRPLDVWIGLSLVDGGSPGDPRAWVWADDAGPDAYPPEWGLNASLAAEPTGQQPSAVSFAPQVATDPVDDTLVANDLPGPHAFVCQLPAN